MYKTHDSRQFLVRCIYVLAVFINLFLLPWWWTLLWCLVGCWLFPHFIEAVFAAVLIDSVFLPHGFPWLVVTLLLAVLLSNVRYFYPAYRDSK